MAPFSSRPETCLRGLFLLFMAAAAIAAPLPALSQSSAEATDRAPGRSETGILRLLPQPSVTEHTIDIGARILRYRATAGTLPIRDGAGKTTAKIFFTAYDQMPADGSRPVTFVFNGGPGAASAYLHLGGLGPRIVALDADGEVPAPPARLEDNPQTWLSFTDLVFVDPVGTGYSRAADPGSDDDFWGVSSDRDTMAAFIRLYLARNGRATSPVYLAGESYGGFRAALLAKSLPEESGIGPSGLVLISPALDFSLLFGGETGQILTPALVLPSMAAVKLVGEGIDDRDELRQRLDEVETFALGDYLVALAAGPAATREHASRRIADLTGLPLDLVRKEDASISASVFAKTVDGSNGEVRSRYDGAVAGPDIDVSAGFLRGPDAILDRMGPIWTSAMVDYVRRELGYRTDVTYRLLEGRINGSWDYGNGRRGQGYADAMDDLQEARALNPQLKVMIAHGFTDLVTPYLGSRFLVDQLPALEGAVPITLEDYLGGHMMYMRADTRRALHEDVEAMYAAGASRGDR